MKTDRSILANFLLKKYPFKHGKMFTWKCHLFMSSAAYMTNVSKRKQCGPDQTDSDLDPHCLPFHIHVNNVSKYLQQKA